MSRTCPMQCMVARDFVKHTREDPEMFNMFQESYLLNEAHLLKIVRLSMAENWNRSVEIKGVTYLIVVDYFSLFPEVIRLTTTTSSQIITSLKSLFGRYGIPEEVISDNGPQYISQEMKTFTDTYGFKHTTSIPYYPQGNGLAERTSRQDS